MTPLHPIADKREARARECLAAIPHSPNTDCGRHNVVFAVCSCDRHIRAMLAFATAEQQRIPNDEPCEYCGGYGVIYTHTAGCDSDFCALAGGYDDCDGIIEPCAACERDEQQRISEGEVLEEAGKHWLVFKRAFLDRYAGWPAEGIEAMQALNRLLPNSCALISSPVAPDGESTGITLEEIG